MVHGRHVNISTLLGKLYFVPRCLFDYIEDIVKYEISTLLPPTPQSTESLVEQHTISCLVLIDQRYSVGLYRARIDY